MNNGDKIRKWLEGELSDAEKKQFEATEEYAKIDRLVKAVNNFKAPEYDPDKKYREFSENVFHKKETFSLYRKISPVLRIAAIFIFTLMIGYFVYDQYSGSGVNKEWITDQTEFYLPDSSLVLLNADSQIKVAESEWENERKVELKGEAFFKVNKGSRFNVKTRQGIVTVLGTEFGVTDRSSYYMVTCYTGLVQVLSTRDSVTLKPGSVYRIINNKAENYSVSNKLQPDWLSGESSFRSVPLKFVINELERQYKVTVKTKNVDLNQLFSGSFSNRNMDVALESLTFPFNLDYEVNGNKIVLSFEGN
jgi:transmembrane sensor